MKSNTKLIIALVTLVIAALTIVESSKAFMKKTNENENKSNYKTYHIKINKFMK
jgi:hypothetical protein